MAQERKNNGRLEATNTQMEEGTRRLTNQHTYIYKENNKQRERKGVKRTRSGGVKKQNRLKKKKKKTKKKKKEMGSKRE